MNKATVRAVDGIVVNRSENNENFGYIRVTQVRDTIDEDGWVKVTEASGLVLGTVKDLERLKWTDGQELPGKVIFREQMLPFNKVNPEKDLKIAGETKIPCKVNGAPIYRRGFYVSNPGAEDKLITHTNGEEIKVAYEALKEQEEGANLSL